MKTTPERTRNPGPKSPLAERSPATRGQLQLRIKKRDRARRTPLRAQLRVQAQLRAHARRLAQIQRRGLRETDRQAQIDSDDGFEKVWALVPQAFKSVELVNRDSAVREEERKEALIQQAATEDPKTREEELASEQAAAAEVMAKEIQWIHQEARDSILILAGMAGGAMRPLATGYAQILHDDYVRRLVGRTNDLLEYLWDKVHSGDWICPQIKEAIDLDRLLGLVHSEVQGSYFPSATQDRAASLLRKWHGEDCDGTDDSTSPAQEVTSQSSSDSESSDGDSSGEESEAEGELPSVGLQCQCQTSMSGEVRVANNTPPPACTQAAEPQRSPFAQNAYKPSPFAQNHRQPSQFAQNTQQRFVVGNQQYSKGSDVSFAGRKRV